jgi:UDP-N-acetylmuramate-alanine ligase
VGAVTAAAAALIAEARLGDVVLTLGAGDGDYVGAALLSQLGATA